MPISFEQFPANWKLPLFWAELDNSQAGLPTTREPALVVGQMFEVSHGASPAGTGQVNVPIPIGTRAQAQAFFGRGSMIASMFTAYFNNNFGQEVWALPVSEPSSGALAAGTVTVTHAPTDAGTLFLYIAGQQLMVGVAANDTANNVASSIVAAVNAEPDLPVTAALGLVLPNEVVLTCKWKGATGNDITVYANIFGKIGGEEYPPGVTLSFPAGNLLSGGTGLPVFTTAIANLGELDFKFVALPYTDQTTINAWEMEYGFGDSGRWGWMRQLYGLLFSARRDTFSGMLAWSATQNSGIFSVMGFEPESPSPVWQWTAAYMSKAARALLNDPARPLQTLELTGILSAPLHERFNKMELNVFATAGIATQTASFDTSNPPMILRESTTYQLNRYGQGDDSYELVTTLATLTRLLRNMKHAITTKYPRHKLADDGTRFGLGQAIVTPKIIKAELVAEYRIDEFNGLVENNKAFKANLIVERDSNDPNRVNVLYPPDLINQLRVFAVLAQFRLQYNRGVDSAIGALL